MLPSIPNPKRYGDASLTEKVWLYVSLVLHLPFVLAWTLLTSPFHPNNAHKRWKRVLFDKVSHFSCENLSTTALQWFLGDSYHIYMKWTKRNNLPAFSEDIGENAKLLWVGKPRTDRVILYLHGGGFVSPLTELGAGFWKHSLTELKDRGVDAGLVFLAYSLEPTVTFPTPLKQTILALKHLISMGVSPQNIQITGDSAGGNLALQLISHMLHPLDGVPHLELTAPIRGVLIISPWVSLSTQGGSFITNDDNDTIGMGPLLRGGRKVLENIPDSQRVYMEAVKAPKSWFQNVETVVDQVLITAGDAECLRDGIVVIADHFQRNHRRTQFVLQKYGVHDEPYFDFFVDGSSTGQTSMAIWEWLAAGFKPDF